METIDIPAARRLALCCAGLLKPDWAGFPRPDATSEVAARQAAHAVIGRFGYLQLDTVSIAGARSHAIVLLSRLGPDFDPMLAEELLQPGQPLFEYWGHEVCWIPLEMYPLFDFRRKEFRHHPWWGDLVGEHPRVAADLLRRIRDDGPLRSVDMEGRGSRGWWDLKLAKRVATALWSSGKLAIRERRRFQRTYDLTERVIDEAWRSRPVPKREALERLLQLALQGHGWATAGTLARTWRLSLGPAERNALLRDMEEKGLIAPCALAVGGGKRTPGWILPHHLKLAERLRRVRPRREQGTLLSPFDPLLWDRGRVAELFGFDQVLEIFKPAARRRYGYYCMPVLAGERLVARVDLKAERKQGILRTLALHFEDPMGKAVRREDRAAVGHALSRYGTALRLSAAPEAGRR